MAQGDQVNVKVKLGSDISGGIAARAELDKVRAAAKKASEETVKSAKAAANGMAGFQKSVSLVRKALTGFGAITLFAGIANGVAKIQDSFKAAKKKAEEFRKAAELKELKKSIDDLADSYARLKEQIAAAGQAEKDALEIIDMEVKARRELQEAKIDAAEQDELAKVDPNALDAAEQKKAISAKYAHMRATNAASNKTEDLVLQRQKYTTAAELNDKQSQIAADQAAALSRKAKQVRSRADMEGILATEANDKDKTGGVGRLLAGGANDILSGNWGNLTHFSTEAGDAEREKHRQQQDEFIKQAEALEKQAEAMKREAEAKKAEAEQNRKRGEALNGSVEASQIAAGTTQAKEELAEADAQRSLSIKRAQIDKDRRYLANSDSLAAGVQGKIDAATATKTAAEKKAAKEKEDAWRAQQALDNFNMENKGRSGSSITAKRKELYDAVVKETEEANQAEAELKGVLATFANTVKDLKTQLEQIKREVAAAQKRTTVASGDGAAAE